MVVEVRLLGGVTAIDGEGTPLDVGSPKCRVLLAALALSAGEPVPASRLIDVVWPDDPPRTADKTLQGYVAQLRRGLGAAAITRSGGTYRLALDPDQVDVARFRRLLSAGDVDGALDAWGGTPLAGLEAPGLQAAADALVDQWMDATEDRLRRRLSTDPAAVIAALTEQTAAHPFREELWALLMIALYRAGRQADALSAFQRAREHLIDELGVEPGPRLRGVEAQILAHDQQLEGSAAAAGPPGPAPGPGPTGTVTFGFAEVADATLLWAQQGRKMAQAITRLDTVVRDVTERHGGTSVVAAGESIGVAFHRADDAATWATDLQLAVDSESWPGGIELRLQVALHTGETAEHGGGYFGLAVHTALRLAAAAHGGQVLLSAVTAALLERDDLRDLGAYRLDGMAGERTVLQLDDGDHPMPRTASTGRGDLPGRTPRLLGRERDLAAIADALEASTVVTLVGPGGVGKTTLALAAARHARTQGPWRVWLAELGEISNDADVPATIAETLGVIGGAGRTLSDSIVATLRTRPTLLVLDNCEHVVAGAAALARAIAAAGGDTLVLATSREPLAIPGEQLLRVEPLDVTGPAVELFAERARAVDATFDLHDVRTEVEEICRRLDGLPLAIELAAARTVHLTPAQLLDRLDDRFRLLAGNSRGSAERHRTLQATVQWSYDLLSHPQQLLFERLAVFAGPFDLSAAETVGGREELDAVETDRLLGDLVQRSIVTVGPGPFGRQFRLLETLREFALDRLTAHGDRETVAARHAEWCRERTADIGRLLTGQDEVEGVARLAELWPDLRAAFGWAATTGDLGLADALVRPVAPEVSLRRRVQIGDWAERILELTPPDDDFRRVYWLLWAGHRHAQAGDREALDGLVRRHGHRDHPVIRFNHTYLSDVDVDAHAASTDAVAWLREHGEHRTADILDVSGVAASLIVLQRFDELDAVAAGMAERHRLHGPATLRYFALGLRGYAAQYQGRHDDAARLFSQAEQLELPAGTYRILQTAQARLAFAAGDHPRAYRLLRDNIHTLLDSDHTDVTRMIAVEFITMMAATDRLADAAHVLPYLDTTGRFALLARESLIADAVRRMEADPALVDHLRGDPDARGALTFMRDVLDELLGSMDAERWAATGPGAGTDQSAIS
ncbi:AfsR/SARP family transcriptional regulator [Geodermatophilus obscurus]|uniref:Transcriptional regulator, winged helix family n=1 Tax=Geodermatophilus obscurus (strain ATCC 25078 / DSM 43160 / JCM 3152 / CCUG 61914 / KCC A-0152 / KCTC 9177 / NBRC 13315 / NRRL B-3577 / G-20) TaxID=526225 RepID=D2SEZ9_GEOOG|nr:BTAD domain-containing putative transcriptional regulator [Geodermatophilus obscurus]ADB74689.1 transcriptional regulator, winged helix family [Geodermatophilus obscurus DSM 43160]